MQLLLGTSDPSKATPDGVLGSKQFRTRHTRLSTLPKKPSSCMDHGGPASIFLDSRSFASPCKNHLPVDLPVRFLVAGRQGY